MYGFLSISKPRTSRKVASKASVDVLYARWVITGRENGIWCAYHHEKCGKSLFGYPAHKTKYYVLRSKTLLSVIGKLVVDLLLSDNRLVAALKLRQHNPRGQNAQHGESKVDSDRYEVVGVALALHSPRNGLAESLNTTQNTGVMRQVGQIGGVLPNQPVEELLESLTAELPEENERVGLSEAALEPVEYGRGGSVVELVLQDGGPDPCTNEDGDDAAKSDLRAELDVDLLVVEERGDDERTENTSEVGEEGAECARANREVGGQPSAHEAVVEVADEEGGEEEQNPAADEELADSLELLRPGGSALGDNERAVLTPHLVCG